MTVKSIPDGYRSITPYLIVANGNEAIEFYKRAFAAVEVLCMRSPGGEKVCHAELEIGDSKIMLADEYPDMEALAPQAFGGSPVGIHLYVENVDQVMQQAVDAGAKIVRPLEDAFYGDRTGSIDDPFGHRWHIATHIEDVTPEEIQRRSAALFGDAE